MNQPARLSNPQLIALLIAFYLAAAAIILWRTSTVARSLVQKSATENAERYSEALSTVRSVYTSEVVIPAQEGGVNATHDYRSNPKTIPLPATLTFAIGDRIGQSDSGVRVGLYSREPFPMRSDRLLDPFQREALDQLIEDPTTPVTSITNGEIRYATADLMRENCVECHNNHPESPKRDWKVGDVRGVLEVALPLARIEQETNASLRGLFTVIAVVFVAGLAGLGMVIRRLLGDSSRLRKQAHQSDAALAENQKTNEILDHRSAELTRINEELESNSDALEHSNRELESRTAALSLTQQSMSSAVQRLKEATNQILSSATQQASGAQQQATSVSEIVATVDELTKSAQQTSDRARGVAESSKQSSEVGQSGQIAVEEAIEAMSKVQLQVESIAESILSMADRAHAIGEITDTVSDIAEQTNVLALNAAVEASRAGEHGKGFSVVAAEVKALATESKKATLNVSRILGDIQKATNTAVLSIESGRKSVQTASSVTTEAGETIVSLRETLAKSAVSADQIHVAARTQASAISQLHEVLRDINRVTQDNVASNEDVRETADALNQIGTELELTLHSG